MLPINCHLRAKSSYYLGAPATMRQKLRPERVEGCPRLRSQAPWARKRARKSTPCAVPLGSGLTPPRGNGRLGQGPAEKNPDREFEGSGPGGSGMEVVASLTPKPRGSPVQGAVHSTLLKRGREAGAARSGAPDRCCRVGRDADGAPGPRVGSKAGGPAGLRVGDSPRLPSGSMVKMRRRPSMAPLHPDRSSRTQRSQPASPRRGRTRGLARASGPPGCGPRTLPAGGGMRLDGGGEGRRCKGAGLHAGPRGAGLG